MKTKTSADVYVSQGEYVTYFDKDFITTGIEESLVIKESALKIAKANDVKPRRKFGTGISKGRETLTLPKRIWKEAYTNLNQ